MKNMIFTHNLFNFIKCLYIRICTCPCEKNTNETKVLKWSHWSYTFTVINIISAGFFFNYNLLILAKEND